MKSLKFILKLSGIVLMVLGVGCIVYTYYDKIREACLSFFKVTPKEFEDFADID